MKKTKVLVTALLASALLASACACGSRGVKVTDVIESDTEQTESGTVAVWSEDSSGNGESVCDAGKISVTVPDGWKAFSVSDMMGNYNSDHDPNAINVYKGALNQLDTRTCPYIEIRYFASDSTELAAETERELYSSVEDINSVKIGDHTWQGFRGMNGDTAITVLTADAGDGGKLTLTVFMNVAGSFITLEDEDVVRIISSTSVRSE